MASKWPPVKNSAYTFRCVLFSRSTNQIQSNPTLSAGDAKISVDGGAFANLATLPDVAPDSTVQVLVSLSASEMNGDEIAVVFQDASGAEWHDAAFVIHTAAQTLDTVATAVADVPTVSEFEARTLAAAAYFDPAADAVIVGTIQADAITASAIAAAAAQEIADAVLSRGVSNVEATADAHSLTAIILAALESSISGTTWTIKRTDGSTTFATKTVTVDAAADPVTSVT